MKSKTSCFNKTIFLKNITHFWPIWLIITGWNLLILPVLIYNDSRTYLTMNLSEEEMLWYRKRVILSLVENYTNPAVLLVFSVVAAMAVFSYLYNSRAAYTMHAFPVTKKELFITNYISGLLFLIVPEGIGFLTGTLVSAACGYTSMDYLLEGLLFAMGISFFFYSFTVFIAMFTGQLFAVPIFTLIINFLYVGGKFLMTGLTAGLCYGVSGMWTSGRSDILSPLYYLAKKVYAKYDDFGVYTGTQGLVGSNVVLVYALAAVIFVAGAYLVYKIRNTETAGSLISVPWVAPVFRWGAGFFGGIMFGEFFCSIFRFTSGRGLFVSLLVSSMIFGAISFFGAQMFLEKGFRVFKKRCLIECAGFAALVAVMIFAVEFDVFGIEKRMPDAADVERAYISSGTTEGGEDEDSIAQVLEIHDQIIKSKREFEKFHERDLGEDNVRYVTVQYYLKGGKSLTRDYVIPAEKEMQADESTVYGKIISMLSTKESYLKNTLGINYEEVEVERCYMDLYREGNSSTHEFNSEDAKKLYEAVLKDVDEGNFEAVIRANLITDENYRKNTYYSDLNFEYSSGKKTIPMYEAFSSYQKEQNTLSGCNIQFDKNCSNIISALIETGVIESQEDLLTYEEMDKLMEEDEVY